MKPFLPAVAGAALLFAASSASAQGPKGYSFMGLDWGIAPAEAKTRLEKAGFRIGREAEGAQEEFTVNGLHAAMRNVDHGRRLVATGRFAGQPINLVLAFGKADQLQHVVLTSQYWDGTIPGAKTLIDLATRFVMLYEEEYGPARKRKEDGWIDTASWPRAADGSMLALYVRGVEGFMFSPSYKTALRVDFVSGKLPDFRDPAAETDGVVRYAKPRALTRKELYEQYGKDPSAREPPPPPGGAPPGAARKP
jgi:hypothetical protein